MSVPPASRSGRPEHPGMPNQGLSQPKLKQIGTISQSSLGNIAQSKKVNYTANLRRHKIKPGRQGRKDATSAVFNQATKIRG